MAEGGRNTGGPNDPECGSPGSALPDDGKTIYRVGAGRDGRLEIPPGLARDLGLEPGAEIEAISRAGGVELRPNIHSLARVYIEPTARCNLSCETCVRNTW